MTERHIPAHKIEAVPSRIHLANGDVLTLVVGGAFSVFQKIGDDGKAELDPQGRPIYRIDNITIGIALEPK